MLEYYHVCGVAVLSCATECWRHRNIRDGNWHPCGACMEHLRRIFALGDMDRNGEGKQQ